MKPIAALALSFFTLACTSRHPDPSGAHPGGEAPRPAAAADPAEPAGCARRGAAPGPVPLDTTGAGSTIALARLGDRTIAFAADEDDEALRAVDIDARAEIAKTQLAGKPGQLLVLADGRIVVALRDRAALEVLAPGAAPEAPLVRLCLVDAPAEPVGLAVTPDGATLLAASRWGHALTAYAAHDLAHLRVFDLPRDPAAVVASADGRRAFVSHAVGGRVSVVDLAGAGLPVAGALPEGESQPPASAAVRDLPLHGIEWRQIAIPKKMRPMLFPEHRQPRTERVDRLGSQGFALVRTSSGAVLAPEVLVASGPSPTGGGYGGAATGTVIGRIAVIDPNGEKATVPPITSAVGLTDCFLPRAAAVDPKEDLLLVACLGIDTVIGYDAKAENPHGNAIFRHTVAAGPSGIAVDAEKRRAVVLSQMDGAITIVPIGRSLPPDEPGSKATMAFVRERPLDARLALGRKLFHAVGTRRIAFDGRACASCHPDGRDDALTWSTPEGPRQTPMLMARLEGTAPYGWEGDKNDIPGHFGRTIDRLAGMGVTEEERDALFAYIGSMTPPATKEARAEGGVAVAEAEVEKRRARGAALFQAEEVGCASCHVGEAVGTDTARHDVASATPRDTLKAFDTPSLRFLGRSAPYFHDGRYPTLLALVNGVGDTMGHTGQLSPEDREALATYLESL